MTDIVLANKPRGHIRRELDIIRKLIEDENLSDNEVIERLQINERTFYRYKSKIKKNIIKAFQQQDNDRAEYTYIRFKNTLEYCYRETKKIIDNPNSKPMERIEAIKTLAVLDSQIATLAKDGPIFKPQLPSKVVEIDAKEVTV